MLATPAPTPSGTRPDTRAGTLTAVLARTLDRTLARALPGRCPGCGRAAEPVCEPCAATIRAAPPRPPPPGLVSCVAAFTYEGITRELVARAKYRGASHALRHLAGYAAAALGPIPVDLVTWAPTTLARRRARGFDHAERLARLVATQRGWPVARLLHREEGPAQTGLALAERRRGPRLAPARRRLAGHAVLVVDDVVTTGATMRSAAAALRGMGAGSVAGLAVARRV